MAKRALHVSEIIKPLPLLLSPRDHQLLFTLDLSSPQDVDINHLVNIYLLL